jgi:apolipoprotein N-acyltransferase
MLLAATLVSAVLHALCFPPFRLHALAWVALVPFLVAIGRAGRWAGPLLAWAWSVLMTYCVVAWLVPGASTYFGQPRVLGLAIVIGIGTLQVGLEYVAFALWYRATDGLPPWLRPLLAAAAWIAAELGRVRLLTGNPWALVGYSQIGVDPLVQVADLAGVYGIGFPIVAVNAGLAEVWLRRRGAGRRQAWVGLLLAALSVVPVLGYGALRLRTAPAAAPAPGGMKVAIVQPNLDLGAQWRPELYGRNLDTYLELSAKAMYDGAPGLLVWPESAMTFFVENEALYRDAIARLLTADGTALLAGGPHDAGVGYFNSAFLLRPDGGIAARYDKQHLLPFAEYFPAHGIDLLRRRFERVKVFSPGGPTVLLPTSIGPAGVVICNEAFYPELAADRVRRGATLLVNLANDTWLGDARYSAQAFDILALRAVEQRRYLLRASTSGPSAIVDPWGRVVAATRPLTRDVLVGQVAAGDTLTPYCRVGDAFAFGCAAAAVLALLLALARARAGSHW